MIHTFDTEIAKKYGVHCAILLNHFCFWIEKNKANNKHFYDGHFWTYNSTKAMAELFPYMTERQISYSVKKLIDEGLLITGNYNDQGRDRTLWYALTDKAIAILQNCQMDFTKMSNGIDKNVKSNITYNKTHIDKNKEIISKDKKEKLFSYGEYKRIKLKEGQYEKLVEDYGKDYIDDLITKLDEYVESNNNKNKYTNFNLVIRKAIREHWFNDKDTSGKNIVRKSKWLKDFGKEKEEKETTGSKWLDDFLKNFDEKKQD